MRQHYSLGFGPLRSGYRAFVGFRPVWEFWGHYFSPMTYLRWAMRFCQRGWRGYADCDHWDGNSYLQVVLLGIIRDLRDSAHGYPQSLSDYKMGEEHEDAHPDTGPEKWHGVLTEIIEGLEASIELSQEETIPEGIYSKGPWTFVDLPGPLDTDGKPMLCKLVDESNHTFNQEAYEAWQAPLLAKRKRGMLLICKYWESFWD